MRTFIKTAVLRPVTVCVLVIILLATGVLATMDMSTSLLPNLKMPMFGVSVVYPGASAAIGSGRRYKRTGKRSEIRYGRCGNRDLFLRKCRNGNSYLRIRH